MEKLTGNMIRWSESKLGSTEYAGWCLALIKDALEISSHIEIYGGDSAKKYRKDMFKSKKSMLRKYGNRKADYRFNQRC